MTTEDRAARLWQDLLDKDDRTSPAEYPEMALITFEEFSGAIAQAADTRAKEMAGLLREAAVCIERQFVAEFNSEHLMCTICRTPDDHELGQQHTAECFVTRLRTAAAGVSDAQ